MSRELLDQLIELVERSRLRELVYTSGRTRIRLVKRQEAPRHGIIRCGETGIFHSRHPLAEEMSAREGAIVAQGQILAYLRTGSVLRPVVAPCDGRVRRQLLPDGAAAGNGDPLYVFEVTGVSSMCRRASLQSAPTKSRGLPRSAS